METHDRSTLVVKGKIAGNRVHGSDVKVEAMREVLVVVVQKDEHERRSIIIVRSQATPSTTVHYCKESNNSHFDLLM